MSRQLAVYHFETGEPAGGGFLLNQECQPGKRHVFIIEAGHAKDGEPCLCGKMLRRVVQRCPTCGAADRAYAERRI